MVPKELDNLVIAYEFVGSRVTCNPPPTDTDRDILLLVKKMSTVVEELEANKWCYDNYGDANFTSFKKKGAVDNLIVTTDVEFYRKFLLATRVCKVRNLMLKADRIAVFDKVFKREPKPIVSKLTSKQVNSIFASMDSGSLFSTDSDWVSASAGSF